MIRAASPSRSASRTSLKARDRVVDPRRERVAVGHVDVGPDRARRAGDAGGVAEARAGRRAAARCRRRASVRAAWETSTLASTCGRCETVASIVSWVSASIAVGRAPSPWSSRCRRSYRIPDVLEVGVRYQVAPSNRSARACSTPAVSAPASGWPPTNRDVASSTAATIARLVEPTSVTTQSSGAAASTAAVTSGRTPTGAATNTASASPTASATSSQARSIAPRSTRRSRAPPGLES